MRRTSTACVLMSGLGVAACEPAESVDFIADVVYDTLADVGSAGETNPLLVYEIPLYPKLLDERTAIYAENRGTLTTVDLLSGDGWRRGELAGDGPGEFGEHMPYFSTSQGKVLTASHKAQYATWSAEGELLEAGRYPLFVHEDRDIATPAGLLDGGVLIAAVRERDQLTPNVEQTLRQGVRAYGRDGGILWSYMEVPPLKMLWRENRDGTMNSEGLQGDGLAIAARHRTVAVVQNREPWVVVLNADGEEHARAELPFGAYDVRVDANERVWVHLWATNQRDEGSYLVFDRDLNEVMRVVENNVQDAFDDYLLTVASDSMRLVHMYLLKRAK